jgi:hypothetical protein
MRVLLVLLSVLAATPALARPPRWIGLHIIPEAPHAKPVRDAAEAPDALIPVGYADHPRRTLAYRYYDTAGHVYLRRDAERFLADSGVAPTPYASYRHHLAVANTDLLVGQLLGPPLDLVGLGCGIHQLNLAKDDLARALDAYNTAMDRSATAMR